MYVFNIHENMNKMFNEIKSGKEKEEIIKQEVKRIHEKFQTTRGYSDLLKGKSDIEDENDLKICSFIIVYATEVLETIAKIIRKHETMAENSFSDENTKQIGNPLNNFHMLIEHYLDIFKEVLILNENNYIYGAISRSRSLIEMLFIFRYLTSNPEAFIRYSDHGFLKYIERSKEWKISVRSSEMDRYEKIKIKYKSEYKTFIKNYGWVKDIKNPTGIGGLIDILTEIHGDRATMYLKDWYKLLSEFSHSSFFVVSRPNRKYIPDFLPFAILYCLEILCNYIGNLVENFMLSEIENLPAIITGLSEIIIDNLQPSHPNIDLKNMMNKDSSY
jgi:hypothetical protein